MEITSIVIIICTACTALVYFARHYSLKLQNYWHERGIHFADITGMGGVSFITNILKKVHVVEQDMIYYKEIKKRRLRFAGYIEVINPVLLVTDPEIIKRVLVTDFDTFVNRRDILGNQFPWQILTFTEDDTWKKLRTRMSCAFTPSKIRSHFPIADSSAQRFVNLLHERMSEVELNRRVTSSSSLGVDLIGPVAKFLVNIISNSGFSLESRAFEETESIWEKVAKRLQSQPLNECWSGLNNFIVFFAPRIATRLRLLPFDKTSCTWINRLVESELNRRRDMSMTRNENHDFLQLILDSNEKSRQSYIDPADFERTPEGLSDNAICSLAIQFFVGGYETTLALILFTAYHLALDFQIQTKLAREVCDSYVKNGNKFTYESINQMKYLDQVVSETLRMYPSIPRLDRRCGKDYKIPEENVIIPAGTPIIVPVYAIHHDEEIYPNPYEFDPERFSKEAREDRNPFSYIPFGMGPRNCIGFKLGLMETKLAISHLIQNFVLKVGNDKIGMNLRNTYLLFPAENDLYLNIKQRR